MSTLAKKRIDKAIKKLQHLSHDLDVAHDATIETLNVVKRAKATTEKAKRDLQLHQYPDYTAPKRKAAKRR